MTALRAAWTRARRLLRDAGPLWTASLVLDRAGLPALGLWPRRAFSPETLTDQVTSILRAWGMPEDQIAVTAEHLLYADWHGIDSHGCAMLLEYHRGVTAGRWNTAPRIEVVREGPTTALVDGGGGLGHVPADTAMKLAIAKCRGTGLGAVAVRNSGHFGAAGAYAALAAREGLLGVATTNTRTPAVVPTFGIQAVLGTNPLAVAAPARRNRPFLLDMATSTVPLGRLLTAWRKGCSIPAGWALDPAGRPVTSPRRAAAHRRLTPLGSRPELGSHKGYGLAAAVEILCGVLPGLCSRDQAVAEPRVGHFFLALDPGWFSDGDTFGEDLDVLLDSLRSSTPRNPRQPVLVAGDPEYAAKEERLRRGIPLSRGVVEDLRTICRAWEVPFLLEAKAVVRP